VYPYGGGCSVHVHQNGTSLDSVRNNITMFLYISIFDDPTRRDYHGRTCDSMIVSPDESDVGEGDLDSGCDRCRWRCC
jgi:hypothetical protein